MTEKPASTWEGLCDFVRQEMEKTRVPGLALGVLYQGEANAAGFGVTSTENPLPVTPATLFQVGSITKTFTAMAAMRLVEMGKLELDVPLQTYLPKFKVADKAVSAAVTLRHLLTHTAGWEGDLFLETGAGDDALPKYMAEMAGLEQVSPLGEYFSYNNSGFKVAGYLIEKATGKSYTAAISELGLKPLGLEHVYFDAAEVISQRFAVGHHAGEGQAAVARPWALPRSGWPAGGMVTGVVDLLRYARFHFGDGKSEDGVKLMQAETLALMHTPQIKTYGDESVGLSWFVEDRQGTRLLSHGGGTNGQVSKLMLAPQREFALAVFTNADSGGGLVEKVANRALKDYFGLEKAAPKPVEATTEELAKFTGLYTRPFTHIELAMLCGRLVGQMVSMGGFPTKDSPPPPAPPPMTLGLCAKDQLIVLDGAFKDMTLDVVYQPDRTIGWLRSGGRLVARR
jgi:CubicO group peptidase (beta-lactamase class C family)